MNHWLPSGSQFGGPGYCLPVQVRLHHDRRSCAMHLCWQGAVNRGSQFRIGYIGVNGVMEMNMETTIMGFIEFDVKVRTLRRRVKGFSS